MTLRAALRAAAIVAVGVGTALFRFLSWEGSANDHFLHLAGAQQWLLGEWPTKDFADPGLPLMYAVSALAQAIGGHSLLPEAVLVATAFGLAAALTMIVALQLTSSLVIAIGAALFEVAIVPRTYGYPKVLLYAAAFVLFQRYIRRPTTGRLGAMAACAAVAFLFRHDHGLYLAVGGGLTALLVSPEETWRGRATRGAMFTAIFVALLLPYFAYVQAFGGLGLYLRTGIAFSVQEAARQGRVWPNPFVTDQPAEAIVLYLFHAVPLAAIVTLFVRGRREMSRVLPLIAVAVLVNFSFMRDPLGTRLPDAVVPAVVLGAWLTSCAWSARQYRGPWIAVSFVVLVAGASQVVVVGNTIEQVDRMGLRGRWDNVAERLAERTAELRERFAPRQIPTKAVSALKPFFAYLDRCTTSADHLLVAGFLPEVPYYAQRPFAGGQSTYVSGYFGSAENQNLVIARLRSQRAPFVLMPSTEVAEFNRGFPLVAAYLRGRYAHMTDVQVDEETSMDIQVDVSLGGASDAETGWPCVR